MVFGVTRLQVQQLPLQRSQLLLEGLRVGASLRRLPCRQLLRQQRLGIRLVLLRPVYGLGVGIQLRVQLPRIFRLLSSSPGSCPEYCFLKAASFESWSSRLRLASSSCRLMKSVVLCATCSRELWFSESNIDVSSPQMLCASLALGAV